MELLLEISKYITALGGILGVFLAVMRVLNKIEKRLNVLEEHSHNDYMNTLKLIIMSEEMPLTERLVAGNKYVESGGNGAIKAKYKLLMEDFEELEKEKAQ